MKSSLGDKGFSEEGGASDGQSLSLLKNIPKYKVRNFWVFLLFLSFVVARYIQLGARRDILATIRFEFLLGILVIALVGYQMGSRKPDIGNSKSILISISLLFLAMIIQLPFAADPITARIIFQDRVIKYAFLTFLMVVMIESPKYMRWFLAAFLFSIFYITLESVRGLLSGGLVWENQGIQRLHGAVPIYQHPNSLGGVAMGTLPFIVFLFPVVRKWYIRIGLLALAATSLVCVVYSGSRTAYMGLLAFILWWGFQSGRKKRFLFYLLLGGVIFLAVIPDQYIERFESIGGQEKEGHSSETRMVILNDAVTIFAENPLGVGVGSFPFVRMMRFNRRQDTHNLYLEVATNLGVQGLIVFLTLIWVMMLEFRRVTISFRDQRTHLRRVVTNRDVSKNLKERFRKHDQDLQFLISVAQSAGGFILIRLVLGLFGMDLYEVYWWFGAGLAVVLSGLVISTSRNTSILSRLAQNLSVHQ